MTPAGWWWQLLLVMAGGALGAAGRFWAGGWLLRQFGDGFPWGTFAVNLAGSFAVGFVAVMLEGRGPSALYLRAFLIVGVLGGLTTFSALMLECLLYARSQRGELTLVYLSASVFLGLLLVWAGSRAAAMLHPAG
ncbi:fluoride efflux transporter CrcB [Luteimonas aquatica]|uniref:fluoride efflux transporter CrcB n=1 Tax=Luteimonas aquatica TaxID=450364 RepID=UPI001F59A28A|nr:fluoride efflux transporter CrcB [Luteimonas aquatica]